MKFNIKDYPGKYVMHCKTKEEAISFCNYLHSIGRKWCTGTSYVNNDYYGAHGNKTAYAFNEGAYSGVDYYKFEAEDEYIILEWEDFMEKTFTKANLKTGDIIKQRNGAIGVINRQLEMITCKNGGWIDLDRFNGDLTNQWSKEFDIVLVRRPKAKADCNFDAIRQEWGELVYDRERDEVEEMTLEQVCKLLGKTIKIVK